MLKVYGIPNCDTVKKAITWLKDHNVTYEFHDYKKLDISEAKRLEAELRAARGSKDA
jgi:arsenate reductase